VELAIRQVIDREICHFVTSDLRITSSYNRIYVDRNGVESMVRLPGDGWKGIFGLFRLSRRALRLDKCNILPVEDGFIAVRQHRVYHYDESRGELTHVLDLKNCRNLLHQSIAVTDQQELFFGEYGSNPSRSEVPVYRSQDGGRHWETIYAFPAGKTRHVHGCYYDPYEDRIWTFTGDFKDECHVLCSDKDFNDLEWIGNENQTFRTCNAFFEKDSIHWIMDSQLENSYHIKLDRATRQIEKKKLFPGPGWYIKRLEDGWYLAGTAQEIGPGVKDDCAHLLISKDLEEWEDLHQFEHDGFPKRYFKFGVIGFPDGPQRSDAFYIFCEALKGLDGKTAFCEIN
jgi:hypothetical protein